MTFQEILRALTQFWESQGCIIHQGYDLEVGAGTFNPATFLRCLGPEPYRAAYIEPSRRPADGRYGENPIRMQHYFQYQVVLKPSPANILDLYLQSLEAIGFTLKEHDIRFVHDDWESPTLGAWGLGWEVWMDGMEVTQFTYFQSVGGQELHPITGEITYGIERLSTFLQKVDSTFQLQWSGDISYGDIYKHNEWEWSHYNFQESDSAMWQRHFDDYEKEAKKLIDKKLPLPAYDFVMKASHAFNMLDARGAISVSQRSSYIAKIRDLARLVAQGYLASRKEQNYPLLDRFKQYQEPPLPTIPSIEPSLLRASPKETADFALEIGVEELPALFVPLGIEQLKKALEQLFDRQALPYDTIHVVGTPRRLIAYVTGLALATTAQQQRRRGPALAHAYDAAGRPTAACEGFFRSLKITPPTPQEAAIEQIKGTNYLMADISIESRPTACVLQESLPELILKLDFPKKMRWGNQEALFPRPIKWLLALLKDYIVPFRVADLVSDRITYGHRQRAPHSFSVAKASDLLQDLKKHAVLADPTERKAYILQQLEQIKKELDVQVVAQEKVLDQVLHLVEWPELTHAPFNPTFLAAPKEILICEMVEHQKYFPLMKNDGNLHNAFVITADNTPSDLIRKGNQKVLSARLADGTFLYQEDLKIPLETFQEKLKQVVFLPHLGSLHDKTLRLEKHAHALVSALPLCPLATLQRAAHLAKADLVSGVVYEFPELQGVMGRIYAQAQGESTEVALALEEHWMPRAEQSPLPTSGAGILLSVADKIDNLLSCFSIGLKPTSSSDPYALRRQSLGLIRILLQIDKPLALRSLLETSSTHFENPIAKGVVEEVFAFIMQRAKTVFAEMGLPKDTIEAAPTSDDLCDTYRRLQAVQTFRQTSAFPALFEAYKRAKGQVPQEPLTLPNFSALHHPVDIALYSSWEEAKVQIDQALKHSDYPQAYEALASLQKPIGALFEQVKVLDDDLEVRKNRLAILQALFRLFDQLLNWGALR